MQRLKLAFTVFGILICSASLAFAAGDGESHESWLNLLYRVANFVLFGAAIYYFFGKKIIAFLTGRTEGIATEIASLEERKAEAQRSLADVEKRIANLEEERKAVLAEYTAQGQAMKATIIAQAEKSAAQITAQAKTTAQNEINAAVEAMRAEMADKIVEATEKLLSDKLSAAEHTKLVDKYLTKVVLN